MDPLDLFLAAAGVFRGVLLEVRGDQHHLSTPCEPLDVSELVSRAIGHQNWVRSSIAGPTERGDYPPVDPGDWVSAFDESTAAMVAELRTPGAMDRPVALAAGLVFPGGDVAVLAARNIYQFAWDLAVATEQDPDIGPEVGTELLEISRTRLVPQRGPGGFFGPEYVPRDGSPVATVLAGYLGREV